MSQQASATQVDQFVDDLMLPLPLCDQPIEDAYTIDSVIGEGSYSTVHAARSRCSGECVVVKAVRVDTLDRDERQVVLQEAQTLSHLRHSNIIRYHGVRYSKEQASLYIIMEHAPGGDLGGLIQQRAYQKRHFSEEFILLTFVQITLALSHVHAHGFLHRDIKSSNVFLLGHDSIVKLGDFGLATMVQPSESSLSSTPVGTPCYRSPESCENKPCTEKSDIWSLGCLLYELTTLKRAFDGSTMPALMVNILMGRFSPVPSRFSVHLCSLIRSMLSQNPARRPTADAILKLPWMQPYLQQYSELMRKQLPVRWPRASDASSCSVDTMTLAMPPMIQPEASPGARDSSVPADPQPGAQHIASGARTKAACKEVRRLLGSLSASLSARIKETPASSGASLRSSLAKGRTAGARIKASASQRIRSFCVSDTEDVHIAPVLKPMEGASTSQSCLTRTAPSVPAASVEVDVGSGESRDATKPVCQDANAALDDLSSLSSLSSVCSQPTRSKEDEAPWGSIVPVQGLTLCSPETKSGDQIQLSISLPAERSRPRTPLLPHHSLSAGTQSSTARPQVFSEARAELSSSQCSPQPDLTRAGLRSAHEMARDTHKDSRHASGHRLVSKTWLQDNLAALDQMQGVLTKSMEFPQTSALERCQSRASSRTSPVPTIATDMSTATSVGGRAREPSVTPSPRNHVNSSSAQTVLKASPSSSDHKCCGRRPGAGPPVAPCNRSSTSIEADRYGLASLESSAGLDSAANRPKHVRASKACMSVVPSFARTAAQTAAPDPLRNGLRCAQRREGHVSTGRCRTRTKAAGCSMHAVRSMHAARTSGGCGAISDQPGKELQTSRGRSQLSSVQRPAHQKHTTLPLPGHPTKAQERAAERRRAAEMQAAHRLALKHVKARVCREDIKKAGTGLGPDASEGGLKCSSRPDAPAFVIPAVSAAHKVESDNSGRGLSRGNIGLQKRVRSRGKVVSGGGKCQLAENADTSQMHAGGSRTVRAPRVAPKERRPGGMLQKHGARAHVAVCGDPAVEIYLPRCRLPQQAYKTDGARVPADNAAVDGQPSVDAVCEGIVVVHQSTESGLCRDELVDDAGEFLGTACHATREHPCGPQAGVTRAPKAVPQVCLESAVVGDSEALDTCKERLSSRQAGSGSTSLTKTGIEAGQGPKSSCRRKGAADVSSRSGRKGSGSAPGRLRSPERKSSSSNGATAARVEELRVRLEAQLGPEKLHAACKSLDSDAAVTSADDTLRQLEALLAPQTHFAYAVYRLKMMEDIVFR